MATHTPAPWTWVQPRDRKDLLLRLADARDFAVPERERENLCSVAHGEIVHLAAVNTDLLTALKDLHGNIERDLSGYWTESTSNFMQQAEAAIAKAEGRS